jgi:hypothetical protein
VGKGVGRETETFIAIMQKVQDKPMDSPLFKYYPAKSAG